MCEAEGGGTTTGALGGGFTVVWVPVVGGLPVVEVATVAESGYPGYEDYTWIAFFAPARTPRAIVLKLNQDIAAVLKLSDTSERLAALGFDPISNTPDEFTAYVKVEVAKWAKVIKDSGARVD